MSEVLITMLADLESHRLEVVLVPLNPRLRNYTDGGCKRVVADKPPVWYRNLCNEYLSSRAIRRGKPDTRIRRANILRVLGRLCEGRPTRSKYAHDLLADQGNTIFGKMKRGGPNHIPRNEGTKSAARFFYCAKASRSDREEGCDHLPLSTAAENVDREPDSAGMNSPRAGAGRTSGRRNNHPTVKPTELMRYLCRLVTPPNGLILDPFTGSGSTGKAALLEGFRFVGVECEEAYCRIAAARLGDRPVNGHAARRTTCEVMDVE